MEEAFQSSALPDLRLIAAAPELLEALEGVVQYASDTLSGRADGPQDVEWHRDGWREIRSRARSAIAKASPSLTATPAVSVNAASPLPQADSNSQRTVEAGAERGAL